MEVGGPAVERYSQRDKNGADKCEGKPVFGAWRRRAVLIGGSGQIVMLEVNVNTVQGRVADKDAERGAHAWPNGLMFSLPY